MRSEQSEGMMCFGQARQRFEVGKVYWTAKGRAVVLARIGLQSGQQHQLIVCHIEGSGHCTIRLHNADGTVSVTDPRSQHMLAGFTLETSTVGDAEVAPDHPPPLDFDRQRPSAPFTHDHHPPPLDPNTGGRTSTPNNGSDSAESTSDTITTPATNEHGVKVRIKVGGKPHTERAEVSQVGSPLAIIGELDAIREQFHNRAEFMTADTIARAIDTIKRLDRLLGDRTSSITDGGSYGLWPGIASDSDASPS